MNWNWDHLRYFLALADAGSLSQAARDLGVSHTTVLRRVRSIEKELETHLFDHTGQGHKLTAAGKTLYSEVQKMQLAVNDIARKISGADQEIEGPVSVTTTDTMGYYILPPIVTRLYQRYPQLSITLTATNQMSDIDKREADIALRTCSEPPPNLVGRKIGTIRFCACASREYIEAHKLSKFPQNTADHNFILLDKQFSETPFYTWLDSKLELQSGRITASGMLTAYALCTAGAGITVLPDYLIHQSDTLQELPSDNEVASNDLWLLSHVDLRNTVRIKLVKNFLFEELSQVFA